MRTVFLFPLFVVACAMGDRDGDGFSGDCDDKDVMVHPYAFEMCDGLDNNCDGRIDEGWQPDQDDDGFGDPASAVVDCELAVDSTESDCDDADPERGPHMAEACNGVDDNCNGAVDEDLATLTFHADLDQDGFGSDLDLVAACAPPNGYVPGGGDCDDAEADTYPGAWELCDERDNNCDRSIDEAENLLGNNTNSGGFTLWEDRDLDGGGNPYAKVIRCEGNDLWLAPNAQDCDDTDPSVPVFAEYVAEGCADGKDNDCDGQIDDADDDC